MQITKQPIGGGFLKQKLHRSAALICLLSAMPVFFGTTASALQLVWDGGSGGANTTGTAVPGSGNWDTNNANLTWFNGTADVAWSQNNQTYAVHGAVFNGPDAAAGTYQVDLDKTQMAFTNLTFNANGYFIYGTNSLFSDIGYIKVADGVSVTISNNVTGNGNAEIPVILGTGPTPASLTLLGNIGTVAGMAFTSANGSVVYVGGAGPGRYLFTSPLDVNATVIITNGTYQEGTGNMNVGRSGLSAQGVSLNPSGTLIVDGSNTVVIAGESGSSTYNVNINLGAGSGQGKVIVRNGGTVNAGTNSASGVTCNGNAATYSGWLEIDGGSFNIGNEYSGTVNNQLGIMTGGCVPGCVFTLYQTNGTFSAAGGIVIGGSGTFNGGYVGITNAGGFFNIGPMGNNGIKFGAGYPAVTYLTLSGGTVTTWGGSWATALPITLATQNGNITFQCADTASGAPYNISLGGALSGPGGLNKTGGGMLTLGAQNTYVGTTVVSNGTLVVQTATLSTNGPVVLDGSAGSPILSLQVGSSGQYWSIGNLTCQIGSPTADFNFGIGQPSTTVAPIQCAGSVALGVVPSFTVEGSAIPTGTFPLVQYTGTASGFTPTIPYFTGSAYSGYVTNIAAKKIIALVVMGSSYSSAISWRIGSGTWDTTTANWTRNGVASTYVDGADSVTFDDTASGASPIAITLNSTVNPNTFTGNSATKSYSISGKGAIAGGASLAVTGAGSLAVATTNTFSGGTTVSGQGLLDINFGGDASGTDSAIGTGALTVGAGAILDNTSGHAVSLVPNIPEFWKGSWTFNGSGNLDMGPGSVTLGDNVVNLTVVSNTLSISGSITDSGVGDKLVKTGAGALTLGTDNQFSGGFELQSGTLNLGSPGCLGSGIFTIDGGAIDNVSGSDLYLYSSPACVWAGSFSFVGTGNLDLGAAQITPNIPLTVNVISNTFATEGDIVANNTTLTKTGAGTWAVGGNNTANDLYVFTVTVNQGELDLARVGGNAIGTGGSAASAPGATGWGLVVQSNALAKVTGTANQIYAGTAGKRIPLVLNSGGAYDINGENQSIDLVAMNNGIVRNGLAASYSTLTVGTNYGITLVGNCVFDVPSADSTLNIAGTIRGGGNLVETGLGTVTLVYSNNYQGNITVSGGTLSLTFPDITNTAVVTIATNAATGTNGVLNLNFANSDTVTVAGLVVGGVGKPAGLYSATTDPLYITGSGSLLVVPPAINPLAGPLQFNVTGRTLALSWPTNSGWILESQTNSLAAGLGTNWVAVPGSTSVTSTNITIDPANGDVYFRLAHP